MLWALASQAGQVLTRDDLLNAVRGIEFNGLDRSVDVCVSKLRRKLDDDPRDPARIKTVWGKGYLFSPKAHEGRGCLSSSWADTSTTSSRRTTAATAGRERAITTPATRNGRPSARVISSSATRCRPSWPASRARAASGWSSSCRPNRRSDPGIAAVYSALGLLLCAFMLVWALPIWRDLEALKTAAARMGQGDLQARARLSPFQHRQSG